MEIQRDTKVGDLPEFRFQHANKQYHFVNTGMDMFGSFYIEGKKEGTQLHYVCLFICLVIRAVQLEVCHDLSTDCMANNFSWPSTDLYHKVDTLILIVNHWNQPSNEVIVSDKLPTRQRVHQTAIGSTKLSVEF